MQKRLNAFGFGTQRRLTSGLCLLLFIAVPQAPQVPDPSQLAGRWQWQGDAGWQRVRLDLKARGKNLSGTISLGSGQTHVTSPDSFWEYLVEPLVFELSNLKVDGNTIRFEHMVNGPYDEHSAIQSNALLRYSGTWSAKSITLVRESVRRNGGPIISGGQKVRFTLERAE